MPSSGPIISASCRENPKKELVQLYIGNQMNSTTYGMLTDLREMISELREQYREAWLEEATPFRLQSALYRWDAEWELLDGGATAAGSAGVARLERRRAVPAAGIHPAQGK